MNNEKVLDVSWGTILKIAIGLLGIYLVFLLKDIFIWLIFALVISILFNPAVNFLQKRKLPRVLSAILIYVIAFGLVGGVIYSIASPLFLELQEFVRLFPQYFERIAPPLSELGIIAFENVESFTAAMGGWLTEASANIFSALAAIFGGILSTITIFAMAIFLSIEERWGEKAVALLVPRKYESYVLNLWERSQVKISKWFGSRILLCCFVGILTAVACYVLDIKYVVSFGLLAGILNIVPIIGPIITGAMLVSFCAIEGLWVKAIFILVIFVLIQQIEGNILTPLLSKKFIGLPPILVLVALMVGGKLWGILGAVLAVPLFGLFYEFLRDFLSKRKEKESVAL